MIEVFAWQAYLNGLPCFQNLLHRQVLIEGKCVFCVARVEDITHILIYCSGVRSWWAIFLTWMEDFVYPL